MSVKNILSLISLAVGVILISGCKCTTAERSERHHSPWKEGIFITREPRGQYVPIGGNAHFEVTAKTIPKTNEMLIAYQWFLNAAAVASGTNRVLAVMDVTTNDVGYYSCKLSLDSDVVISEPVGLMAFSTNIGGGPITIYSTPPPTTVAGVGVGCPFPYVGYHNFIKPVPPYGWVPNTSAPPSAKDFTRTDTKIKFFGSTPLNNGCGTGGFVSVTPIKSSTYRFTIYFPNNVPATAYPLQLNGFDP
jgi:hypothetical protein